MKFQNRISLFSALLFLVSACALAPAGDDSTLLYGVKKAPPCPQGEIRLAAYNVENLFDDKDDPNLSGRFDDIGEVKPESELKAVAAAIHAVNADIISLEEVESLEAVEWFRDKYLSDMGYKYAASIDVGYYRGIENAVLSRYPIIHSQVWVGMKLDGEHPKLWNGRPNRYYGQPLTFRRSPLCVDIKVSDDYQLRLYVVHHKAGKGNEYWREAESRGVIKLVQQAEKENPKINIAVLGDFNSQPEDLAIRQYLKAGLIDTQDYREVHCDKSAPLFVTHESGRTLDYIFTNSALYCEVVPGSSFIFSTPARPEGHDWRVDPLPKGYGSDHYPVAVDLIPRDGC